MTAGDPDGVGRRVRYLIKGRLPMRLAFAATTARVNPPRELVLRAEGSSPAPAAGSCSSTAT